MGITRTHLFVLTIALAMAFSFGPSAKARQDGFESGDVEVTAGGCFTCGDLGTVSIGYLSVNPEAKDISNLILGFDASGVDEPHTAFFNEVTGDGSVEIGSFSSKRNNALSEGVKFDFYDGVTETGLVVVTEDQCLDENILYSAKGGRSEFQNNVVGYSTGDPMTDLSVGFVSGDGDGDGDGDPTGPSVPGDGDGDYEVTVGEAFDIMVMVGNSGGNAANTDIILTMPTKITLNAVDVDYAGLSAGLLSNGNVLVTGSIGDGDVAYITVNVTATEVGPQNFYAVGIPGIYDTNTCNNFDSFSINAVDVTGDIGGGDPA
jgi:hypothetical protein